MSNTELQDCKLFMCGLRNLTHRLGRPLMCLLPSLAADTTQLDCSVGGGEFCLGGRVEAGPGGDSPGKEANQGGVTACCHQF